MPKQFKSNIVNSVNKKTDLVVAKDLEEYSSKIRRAKELNIKIISKESFYNDIEKIMDINFNLQNKPKLEEEI